MVKKELIIYHQRRRVMVFFFCLFWIMCGRLSWIFYKGHYCARWWLTEVPSSNSIQFGVVFIILPPRRRSPPCGFHRCRHWLAQILHVGSYSWTWWSPLDCIVASCTYAVSLLFKNYWNGTVCLCIIQFCTIGIQIVRIYKVFKSSPGYYAM